MATITGVTTIVGKMINKKIFTNVFPINLSNVPLPKGQMTPKQPYIHDHYMYSVIVMPRITLEGVVDEKRESIWTINWRI